MNSDKTEQFKFMQHLSCHISKVNKCHHCSGARVRWGGGGGGGGEGGGVRKGTREEERETEI